MTSLQTTLGELASNHPAAARVFHRHGLDFCCGGGHSLEKACSARSLDAEEVLREIDDAATPGDEVTDWRSRGPGALIDHILARFHEPHRDELPRLIGLAHRVEKVHDGKSDCPKGLAAHLEVMAAELEAHMQKEEQVLFPLIYQGFRHEASMPIRMMEMEHDDHGANLRRMRQLARNFQAPADACASWRALYLGLDRLEKDLMDHIHHENNVLFPLVLGS